MSSFTRGQYQQMYNFARQVYLWHESTNRDIEYEAIRVMDMCIDVIGQRGDYPEHLHNRRKKK